jgi:hypothetical protein
MSRGLTFANLFPRHELTHAAALGHHGAVRAGLILALLVCVSCGSAKVQKVTTPDGRQGFVVSCRDPADCMVLAGKKCPHGYDPIDRAESYERSGFVVANESGAYGSEKAGTRQVMMIVCRGE